MIRAHGRRAPLRIVQSGVVYDSGLCQLAGAAEIAADGSIVAAFNRLTDASVGNVGLIYRSRDGGRSWADTGTRLECSTFSEGAIHVAIGMARLPDGRLLLPFTDVSSGRRSPEDHPRHMKNRPRPSVPRMIESRDNGEHWGAPRRIELPGGHNSHYFYGKILCLDDGRIALPAAASTVHPDGSVSDHLMRYYISSDGGASWSEVRAVGSSGGELLGETDAIVLPDGSWRAVSRGREPDMLSASSTDEGRSWAPCVPTGILGHSPSLFMGRNGLLYVAYRKVGPEALAGRHAGEGRSGLGISWSDDGGASWRGELTLLDPKGYRYRFFHETGMPCMLGLPDGRIMVVFYSYDPALPHEPEDDVWAEVAHFYKRYVAFNVLEET